MRRAEAAILKKDFSGALSDLQVILIQEPDNVKAHYYAGVVLVKGAHNSSSKPTDAVLHL